MRSLAIAIVGFSWVGGVSAEALPGFLDSNAIERNLPAPNLPADAYRPAPALLSTPLPSLPPGPQLAMDTRVVIHRVRFEGGTIYPLSDLRDNYQGLLDREVTLAELSAATQRLTQRYQHDGYLLSYAFVPPQDFAEGRLQVVLVEGYIRDYTLTGEVGNVSAYLDQLAEKLKAERPLTRESYERYTTLMSRLPGLTVRAQVPSSRSSDGAAHLLVQASRQPFGGTLVASDSNRDDLRAVLGVSSNAHSASAEQLSVSGLYAPHERYYRAEYTQYLDAEGTQLSLSATRYRQRQWDSQRYALGLNQALIASPKEWFSVAARFYAVRDTFQRTTDVRAFSFEGEWRTVDERRLRIVTGGVYQGFDHLGARTDADADLDFLRLRLAGLQSDRFGQHWQGVASAALYWSDDRLPYSERVFFGGQDFARGYPVEQASGDRGWGAAYELNYRFRQVWQPYVVLDAARVRDAQLSSLAVGVRFGSIALEVARPLADAAIDSRSRGPRVSVSFSYRL